MNSSHKPPLGVVPRQIWSETTGRYAGGDPSVVTARARDLVAAIGRFVDHGELPPQEWQDELQERVAWLYKQADSPEAAGRRVQRQLTRMNASQGQQNIQNTRGTVVGGGGAGGIGGQGGHGAIIVTSYPWGGGGGSGGSK
jgi:hypothetical protein